MNLVELFLIPRNAVHRQYEALRAYFVDRISQAEIAKRFGYSLNAFRVMCCKFRQNPHKTFFVENKPGPEKKISKEENLREHIIELRKKNHSIYDISKVLSHEGQALTPPAVSLVLKSEGFARLPRRKDDERITQKTVEEAPTADVRELNLSQSSFHTKFGGLFLLLPLLAKISFEKTVDGAGFPGSEMIPAPHAIRSLLALKLYGNSRHSHVMSDVFDKGLALFAGLNVIPKSSFLTQYSCRVDSNCYPKLLRSWFDGMKKLKYSHGTSFDLDFHTIPSYGKDPLLEKHYLSKRSRSQKGILAFIANDTNNKAFCYMNADLRKETQDEEIVKFIEFWKEKSGNYPEELVFDSTFTTYEKLCKLNSLGINFITLRRRTIKLIDDINSVPSSGWKKIELKNVSREYRHPKIIEEKITLKSYKGYLRQFAIKDLGHEQPTILITNQMRKSPATLIQRYARRMLIENNIADAIDFFHMDALSSTVALKVNFDLITTILASTLYRIFAARIGNGYKTVKFSKIFRDFISATANVEINKNSIIVKYQKRSHNPMLIAAGFDKDVTVIPWLGNKKLVFRFG